MRPRAGAFALDGEVLLQEIHRHRGRGVLLIGQKAEHPAFQRDLRRLLRRLRRESRRLDIHSCQRAVELAQRGRLLDIQTGANGGERGD